MKKAKLTFEGKAIELDVIVGSENEIGIDISRLKTDSGFITLDPGFKNTGSCESKVTFLDGDNGILRYRGYSIEDLANNADFLEVSYLLIYGEPKNTPFSSVSTLDKIKMGEITSKYLKENNLTPPF